MKKKSNTMIKSLKRKTNRINKKSLKKIKRQTKRKYNRKSKKNKKSIKSNKKYKSKISRSSIKKTQKKKAKGPRTRSGTKKKKKLSSDDEVDDAEVDDDEDDAEVDDAEVDDGFFSNRNLRIGAAALGTVGLIYGAHEIYDYMHPLTQHQVSEAQREAARQAHPGPMGGSHGHTNAEPSVCTQHSADGSWVSPPEGCIAPEEGIPACIVGQPNPPGGCYGPNGYTHHAPTDPVWTTRAGEPLDRPVHHAGDGKDCKVEYTPCTEVCEQPHERELMTIYAPTVEEVADGAQPCFSVVPQYKFDHKSQCLHGEGGCQHPNNPPPPHFAGDDVPCEITVDPCTSACEHDHQRKLSISQFPGGDGKDCNQVLDEMRRQGAVADCGIGEGGCDLGAQPESGDPNGHDEFGWQEARLTNQAVGHSYTTGDINDRFAFR
jgi:hypothetical protein